MSFIFDWAKKSFFPVLIPGPASTITRAGVDLTCYFERFRAHKLEQQLKLARVPKVTELTSIDQWLRRTQWHSRFADQNMRQLSDLAQLVRKNDHPNYRKILVPAVETMVRKCHYAGMRHSFVLYIYKSVNKDIAADKPLRFIADRTVSDYSLVWKHFVLSYTSYAPQSITPILYCP